MYGKDIRGPNTWDTKVTCLKRFYLCTRVLQKVLSLGSDYFSATFYQIYFYCKPSKYSPFTETHFVIFLPSREKQRNSLLFGICWKHLKIALPRELLDVYLFPESIFLSFGNKKEVTGTQVR